MNAPIPSFPMSSGSGNLPEIAKILAGAIGSFASMFLYLYAFLEVVNFLVN